MGVMVDEKELKAAGAEPLDGGLRVLGWEIETRKRSILNSSSLQRWEALLGTTHLPERDFGDSSLILRHLESGVMIHFNAFDALSGWKQEAFLLLKFPQLRNGKSEGKLLTRKSGHDYHFKPTMEVILDYDYTFTTPYVGSENIELNTALEERISPKAAGELFWEACEERIDLAALAVREPILFYDETVLYEDEPADNGVSLLAVKVRVMPSCWFLLLRFWLRVDGVLIRLRDTCMYCRFEDASRPTVLRESCWKEATCEALSARGHPIDSASYNDPSFINQRLPVIMHKTQKLVMSGTTLGVYVDKTWVRWARRWS